MQAHSTPLPRRAGAGSASNGHAQRTRRAQRSPLLGLRQPLKMGCFSALPLRSFYVAERQPDPRERIGSDIRSIRSLCSLLQPGRNTRFLAVSLRRNCQRAKTQSCCSRSFDCAHGFARSAASRCRLRCRQNGLIRLSKNELLNPAPQGQNLSKHNILNHVNMFIGFVFMLLRRI